MIPQMVAVTSGSLFGGFYIKRKGTYKALTIVSYAFLVLAITAILLTSGALRPLTNTIMTVGMIISMCVTSFTAGIGGTTLLICLIANVDPSDQAVATACSYLFRSLGSVVGISLSATVSNHVLRDSLQEKLGHGPEATKIANRVRQSLSYLRQLKPDIKEIVVDCYAHGIRCAFALQIAFICCAAISVWWIREKRLSK